MSTHQPTRRYLRTRWSAIGAAVAISLGAGGIGLSQAAVNSGDKPITVTIEPKRVLDTRVDLGLAGRFASDTPRELQVTGTVPVAPSGTATVVPADASSVLVNVTVVTPSHEGFLSLRPAGAPGVPATSTVNFTPGSIEPNAATVDLGPGGRIQIWVKTASASGSADVLVDIVGYTIDHNHDDIYHRFVSGVKHVSGDQDFPLPNAGQAVSVRSLVLNAPAPGRVIVTASGWFFLGTHGYDWAACAITNGPLGVGNSHEFRVGDEDVVAGRPNLPFSSTRTFEVPAGPTTFRLVCRELDPEVTVRDTQLTALYVPMQY